MHYSLVNFTVIQLFLLVFRFPELGRTSLEKLQVSAFHIQTDSVQMRKSFDQQKGGGGGFYGFWC